MWTRTATIRRPFRMLLLAIIAALGAASAALGIILRNGESLQVTRRNGKRLVITVDDPATAAALLPTFASRTRTMPPVAP